MRSLKAAFGRKMAGVRPPDIRYRGDLTAYLRKHPATRSLVTVHLTDRQGVSALTPSQAAARLRAMPPLGVY